MPRFSRFTKEWSDFERMMKAKTIKGLGYDERKLFNSLIRIIGGLVFVIAVLVLGILIGN